MKEVKKIMAVKRKKNKIKKDDEDEIQCSSCGRYRNKKYFFIIPLNCEYVFFKVQSHFLLLLHLEK